MLAITLSAMLGLVSLSAAQQQDSSRSVAPLARAATQSIEFEPNMRELQQETCGSLVGCALADLTNWQIVVNLLLQDVSYTIDPDVDYSIACYVFDGTIDEIRVVYGNGESHTELSAPYWVGGETNEVPNAIPYLSTPGTKSFDVMGVFGSETCFDHRQVLFALPEVAPTSKPTLHPTAKPTLAPTLHPTLHPTEKPTLGQTPHPTEKPTLAPTLDPTGKPTLGPTLHPTEKPTMHPTYQPTMGPTLHPTEKPTMHPTYKPTMGPTLHPTEKPTMHPTYKPTMGPTLHPTEKPTMAPTEKPTAPPVEVRSECKAGFQRVQDSCLPIPPKPVNCYLWLNGSVFFGHNAKISPGTKVEAETYSGQRYSYPTITGRPTVYSPYYRNFGKSSFKARFISPDGVEGPWNDKCTNYFGTPAYPPLTERCYLWSSKLYFGRNMVIPRGYRVETQTVVGKKFSYASYGTNYVHAYDYRSYDSQPFYLRFIDSYGNPGPWKKCVNYTPIALDLDQSGAVEHIEGEFIIDITGDGQAETLEEWFGPNEGILIDTQHGIEGGIITGHHLFGDMGRTYVDGYEKLALLDVNEDGLVSGDEMQGLAIWIDANSNALLDDGEMSSLESHDVVSLSVKHDHFISEATLGDGTKIIMEDKWFVR